MYNAPEIGEIEVSVFGPGYGEYILVHTGDNDWFLIDSCIELSSKKPSALHYLNQIGIDPSCAVKLVISTHWHDDHIRGISRILKECKVYALSPSDSASLLAKMEISKLLPHEKAPKCRISQSPNFLAVVLLINIDNISILLGSDLEETTEAGTGWSVIVNSKTRPEGKASLFKIPHHGSISADNPHVWEEMVYNHPVSDFDAIY